MKKSSSVSLRMILFKQYTLGLCFLLKIVASATTATYVLSCAWHLFALLVGAASFILYCPDTCRSSKAGVGHFTIQGSAAL